MVTSEPFLRGWAGSSRRLKPAKAGLQGAQMFTSLTCVAHDEKQVLIGPASGLQSLLSQLWDPLVAPALTVLGSGKAHE